NLQSALVANFYFISQIFSTKIFRNYFINLDSLCYYLSLLESFQARLIDPIHVIIDILGSCVKDIARQLKE
ncbi:unnamed protein product, partial [Rotaria sp. Silwood1]